MWVDSEFPLSSRARRQRKFRIPLGLIKINVKTNLTCNIYARATRMPPPDFALWAKTLRGQLCGGSFRWLQLDFLWFAISWLKSGSACLHNSTKSKYLYQITPPSTRNGEKPFDIVCTCFSVSFGHYWKIVQYFQLNHFPTQSCLGEEDVRNLGYSTSHLHGTTGNSGWKIKWIAPFRLRSFRKRGLWPEAMPFFFSQSLFCLSVLPPRQISVLSAVTDPGEGPGGRAPLPPPPYS